MAKFRCNMILFDLAELEEFAEALIDNYQQKLAKKKRLQDQPQINEDTNFTLKFDEIELILQNSPFFCAIQNLAVTLRCNKR